MNRWTTSLSTALAMLAMWFASGLAQGGLVSWDIDETLSSVSLAIPDTPVNLDGTNATIRMRNQSGGNSGPWNVGNKAFMNGFLNTSYDELMGHSIEFLTHSPGDIVGLASGNYRPNPASWNPLNTNPENPDGQYSGTTTDPAVFGARVRASVSIFTVDAGFLAIDSVSYQAESPQLAVSGTTAGSFDASMIDFGILESLIYFDGLSIVIIGQPIPDSFAAPFDNFIAANNNAGLAAINDLGGNDRELIIPINMALALDIEGIVLNASVTGQIVAYATVPEPSTLVLAATGVGLVRLARLRRRTRKV